MGNGKVGAQTGTGPPLPSRLPVGILGLLYSGPSARSPVCSMEVGAFTAHMGLRVGNLHMADPGRLWGAGTHRGIHFIPGDLATLGRESSLAALRTPLAPDAAPILAVPTVLGHRGWPQSPSLTSLTESNTSGYQAMSDPQHTGGTHGDTAQRGFPMPHVTPCRGQTPGSGGSWKCPTRRRSQPE